MQCYGSTPREDKTSRMGVYSLLGEFFPLLLKYKEWKKNEHQKKIFITCTCQSFEIIMLPSLRKRGRKKEEEKKDFIKQQFFHPLLTS